MKQVFLCAIFLCTGLGACAERRGLNESVSNTSFEPTEAASAVPADGETEMPTFANTNAQTAANTSSRMGGGGGGGGQNASPQLVKQNISSEQTTASAINTASSDRKIIRNAELNLEAEDPEDAQRRITGIAESNGGFVVESQQSSSDVRTTSRDIVVMSVRVPSERFSETLEAIRSTATRVVVETVKGQDVTEEFIDIEAQLKSKKALEEQFMSIMKRANSVEDALDVQRQLADVRGEIERIEGRKRFLENQSSLSTIKIRLQTAKVFAASSAGFGARLTDAFSSGFDVAMNFVLGLVTFVIAALPFAAFVGLPCIAIIRYVLRRQARPKSVTEIAEEEIKST
ncbi:MAG: DUF4349 domain-containing protein [Acidobacteriota bacterium]